jgi:hypothetical protein
MITIVDYGLGNISAFLNVYRRANIDAKTAKNPQELEDATRIILPGVGSFDHAMEELQRSGMRETLDDMVLNGACRCSASASACRCSPAAATKGSCRAWGGSPAPSGASAR